MSQGKHSNYFVHTLLRARDWQHRPQFDQVGAWWRDGGRGVCALVGMGGAGKTAIADRFLNELLDDTSTTRQRGSLPESVFVYSFYDDDKPENFFRYLQIWLEGTSSPDKQKSPTQLMFDIQQHSGLMILDGLERVQESGARGGFGRLTSPSLRDLLNHIASGSARRLSVLVTSRFPLTDLRDSQPRFFRTIAIDQIDVAAGIALLRDRGVRGTDMQLAPIVEHCGRHALTIDLVGGYINEYGHGDPSTPLNLGTAEELQAEAEQEPDDNKRAVLKQGIRFARIAQRYREAMLSSDEAALALLERICLFRLPIDCETLAAIFTGPAAELVSGKALASLNADQLRKKVDWLVHMRIVEKAQFVSANNENGTPNLSYTIHPAVRDGFLSGIGRKAAVASHEAVFQRLEFSLGHIPGVKWSDSATLDLLEEIMHHTIRAGHVHEGWGFYWRTGRFGNLGRRLGQNERGRRLCSEFVDGSNEVLITDAVDQSYLFNNLALFNRELGDLKAAIRYFEKSVIVREMTGHSVALGLRNLSLCLHKMGRMSRALEIGSNAVEKSRGAEDKSLSSSNLAHLCLLTGEVSRCGELRRLRIDRLPHDPAGNALLYPMMYKGESEVRFGNSRAAEQTFEQIEQKSRELEYRLDEARSVLQLANLLSADKRLDEASDLHQRSYEWAMACDAKEVICWSALVQARIELARTHKHEAKARESQGHSVTHSLALRACVDAIAHGLKVARDCGYGLYHIDLLLERARLHLLRGDAGAAVDDVEVALDTGIPADEKTGQVELLAANNEECRYAWAIPGGFQLRAEALLLKAAQQLGSNQIGCLECGGSISAEPDRAICLSCRCGNGKLHQAEIAIATNISSFDKSECYSGLRHGLRERFPEDSDWSTKWERFKDRVVSEYRFTREEFLRIPIHDAETLLLSGTITNEVATLKSVNQRRQDRAAAIQAISPLISLAKTLLQESLDYWHDLRDPEPTEDNNFVHPETGKEYNYKARDTYQVLLDLERGILTKNPLTTLEIRTEQVFAEEGQEMATISSPRVFISYTHDSDGHAKKVLQLANRLRTDGIEAHIDQYVQNPSEGWPLWMDNELDAADFVLVVSTERYATKAKEVKRSGGRFESVLILQDLYEGGMSNDKFIPIVFDGGDANHILKWLKSVNHYLADSDVGYESLRRRLLNDPAIVPPPIGIPVKKGPANP
ncbi:MAG TPA: TIR domain-containing protein [Planctomycetaceae bacterium]|nr:TIR domain-containing protein [Planctomycetaceae bacterium]